MVRLSAADFIRRGLDCLALGRYDEAIAVLRQAAVLEPDSADAHYHLAYALSLHGQFADAAAGYRRALALRPRFVEALINLGSVLARQGRLDEAAECYEHALALNPRLAEVRLYLGHALSGLGRLADAAVQYRGAIELRPDWVEAYGHLTGTLIRLGRIAEARDWCAGAIARQPDRAELHYQLALVLRRLDHLDEAAASCERALALDPAHDEARHFLAYLDLSRGHLASGLARCREVLARRPDLVAAHETLLFGLLYRAASTAEEIFAAHRRYAVQFETGLERQRRPHRNVRDPERPLKVGYVSADFRYHSVAFFMEPLLTHHDRSQVEVFCYHSHSLRDAVTDRLESLADRLILCGGLSDEVLAERIREDGIDILVDLAGHTGDNRLLAFARKPAPVQVTYLGYPTTTGLAAMDYRLTTVDVDPEGVDRFYSERLYRLPRTLWCYRSPLIDSVPAAGETPALSRGSVTFGSMNNVAKVSDETVGVWGAILNRVAGAHLVMTSIPEGSARERLWERFKAQGVEPGRVELYGRLPTAEFVGLMNRIDIALDPFPYNGTTTTCEALWRGVPVVGVEGRTSVSRSGYALLKTAGLEELCGKDEAHYVEIAVRLAKDLPRLNGLRQGMRQRLEASPLRDEAGFARDVEAAYRAMWREYAKGAIGHV